MDYGEEAVYVRRVDLTRGSLAEVESVSATR